MASWRSAEGLAVIGGLLLVAAIVVVTSGGPVDFLSASQPTSRPSLSPSPFTPPATPTPTPGSTSPWEQDSGSSTPPPWVEPLRQLLVLLTLLAAAYLLFRLGRYLADVASRRSPRATVPGPAVVTPLPEVPQDLLGAPARRRRALLGQGEPRNAIVATWLDLEESLVASGLPRRPAETPGEYVARVLTTWDVDVRALADLADLYREARFSSHPMDQQQRDRAMRDLDQVHADLAAAEGARW